MHDWNIAYCYVSVLKTKDMSKIKSSFKRQFILSVIRQFNERGFLTHKQLNIIGDMFNNKDNKNYFRLAVELGLNDKQNLIDIGMMTTNDFKKEEK